VLPASLLRAALEADVPSVAGDVDMVAAVTLGVLQGITEFLPVSSSGHIAIGAMLFELRDPPLALSIVLHLGTLIATLALLGKDVWQLTGKTFAGLRAPRDFAASDEGKTVLGVILATVPTALIGLAMRDHVEAWQEVPWIVGVCLLVSAVAVLSTLRGGGERLTLGLGAAILVGVVQGLAVLPGVSRSGSTIACAMLLGMSGAAAFRFSFLLSLPAVAGACVLELSRPGALEALAPSVWIGGLVATVVGVASIVLLKRVVIQGRFWAFAIYLVPVGCLMIAWRFL